MNQACAVEANGGKTIICREVVSGAPRPHLSLIETVCAGRVINSSHRVLLFPLGVGSSQGRISPYLGIWLPVARWHTYSGHMDRESLGYGLAVERLQVVKDFVDGVWIDRLAQFLLDDLLGLLGDFLGDASVNELLGIILLTHTPLF